MQQRIIMKIGIRIFIVLSIVLSISISDVQAQCVDLDNDLICDDIDPCPGFTNTGPLTDSDMDGIPDECDNCPTTPNADQADADGDGMGDACDSCNDPDRDGVCGANDKCPGSDDRIDEDRDGIPDGCDSCIDRDRDNICDNVDDCIASVSAGRNCDDGDPCTVDDRLDENCNCVGTYRDSDGDGVCDAQDDCEGADDSSDYDNDGVPDACDPDPACSVCSADERGRIVICHIPLNPDNLRTIKGSCKEMTRYFNKDGSLAYPDDRCGPCECSYIGDTDRDGDGVCDRKDQCPDNPDKATPGKCGCDDQDSDGDGVCDSVDLCLGYNDKEDEDGDGIPDGCDEVNYCVPEANSSMEWIKAIRIDDREMLSEQNSGFFYHKEPVVIEQQVIHSMTITPEFIDDVCDLSIIVLIDLNGDGDFEDEGEEMLEEKSLEELSMALDVDKLTPGQYRMRVMVYLGRLFSLCDDRVWGEVEDFIIEVVEPQPCQYVYEGFQYELGSPQDALDGGVGWSDRWGIVIEGIGQTAIFPGSLDTVQNQTNKLGILVNTGSTAMINRAVNLPLRGADELYFSMKMERVSGTGAIDMSIGDIRFGVDDNNHFYLGDSTGGDFNSMIIYQVLIKVKINQAGKDDLYMWINPDQKEPAESEAIVIQEEIGEVIRELSIALQSSDFWPMGLYIDEINIGCDDNFKSEKVNSTKEKKANKSVSNIEQEEIKIDVWPNPSFGTLPKVKIDGGIDLVYPGELFTIDGQLIWSGVMVNGVNTLADHIHLNSGLYILVLNTSQGEHQQKVVIY